MMRKRLCCLGFVFRNDGVNLANKECWRRSRQFYIHSPKKTISDCLNKCLPLISLASGEHLFSIELIKQSSWLLRWEACLLAIGCVCFSNIEMSLLPCFVRCPHHDALTHYIFWGGIYIHTFIDGLAWAGMGCQSNFNEMCYFDSQAQLIWNVSVEQA